MKTLLYDKETLLYDKETSVYDKETLLYDKETSCGVQTYYIMYECTL